MNTRGDELALSVYRAETAAQPLVTADSPPLVLTLQEAVRLSVSQAPELRPLRAGVAVASAEVSEAGQLDNPVVRVTQLRLNRFLDDEPGLDLDLRFRPPRPGEIGARTAAAESGVREVRAELLAAEREVAANAWMRFQDVQMLLSERAYAVEAVAAKERIRELIAERVEKGLAPQLDVALADLTLVDARRDLVAVETDLMAAEASLRERVGMPPGQALRLSAPEVDVELEPEPVPPVEELVEAALRGRAAIEQRAARIDHADAELHLERAKAWPWLSFIQVGYEFGPGATDGRAWAFGMALELPLFSTNSGSIERAEALRTQAEEELTAEVMKVARRVRERHQQLEAAAHALRQVQVAIGAAGQRATEQAEQALAAGHLDALEVAEVADRRIAVRRRLLKIVRRYVEAKASLLRLVGDLEETP